MLHLISLARYLQCSDVHDCIFGLLGLLPQPQEGRHELRNFVTTPERQLPNINNHNQAVNSVLMAGAEQKKLTAKILFYLSISLDTKVLMFW